jgi:hypothetical protein
LGKPNLYRRLIERVEILDFGYPQNTETDTLKMYITTEGVKSERAMVRLGSDKLTWILYSDISSGGFFKDHNASHRRAFVAESRHQVS